MDDKQEKKTEDHGTGGNESGTRIPPASTATPGLTAPPVVKKDPEIKASQVSGGDANIHTNTRRVINKDKRVKIIIASTETEKDDVVCGINGVNYQIKRGVEADLPLTVLKHLENAQITVYDEERTDEGIVRHPRRVPRFNIQRITRD